MEFGDFIASLFDEVFDQETIATITAENAIEEYWLPAFSTSMYGRANQVEDLQVAEKIGDAVLKYAFLSWLRAKIYPEVTEPGVYSIMETKFTGKLFLKDLSMQLGFDKYARVATGEGITDDVLEDIFEAFLGQLVLVGDQLIQPFSGILLAQKWIYYVYNKYAWDLADPTNFKNLVSYVTQFNEVSLFNGWGQVKWNVQQSRSGKDGTTKARADLIMPLGKNVPQELQGVVIGTGISDTKKKARENAARAALDRLKIEYSELSDIIVDYDDQNRANARKLLAAEPKLFRDIFSNIQTLKEGQEESPDLYYGLQIKSAYILDKYVALIRVRQRGIWVNAVRGRGDTKIDAAIDAAKIFLTYKPASKVPKKKPVSKAPKKESASKAPEANPRGRGRGRGVFVPTTSGRGFKGKPRG